MSANVCSCGHLQIAHSYEHGCLTVEGSCACTGFQAADHA